MKTILIFDLDGTLIQSSEYLDHMISEYLETHYHADPEAVRYYFSSTKGTALPIQIQTFLHIEAEEAQHIANTLFAQFQQGEMGRFFPGVIEVIKRLAQNYTLLLSTGNSTAFARSNLQSGGIEDCFAEILGSERIPKGSEHLEYFIHKLDLPQLREQAIFIGDGSKDRLIAQEAGMPFIHIDSYGEQEYQDQYHISSVALIE
ncbi:MAG: HAD hydrolase-like protein [bacterium]|nr:HAD hydrolase-like protein [bacterium]